MPNDSDVTRFLQAIFGPDYFKHCIFADCPDLAVKKPVFRHCRNISKLDPNLNCYFSLGAFPDDGKKGRTADRVVEMRVFALDDVGEPGKLTSVEAASRLGVPTAKVRSSRDSVQWLYRLSRPVSPAEWPVLVAGIKAKIGVRGLECVDLSHVVRLPMGVNNKDEDGRRGWEVTLEELNPGAVLDVEEFLLFGAPAASLPSALRRVTGTQCVHDIKRLVALVPNKDMEYDEWIAVGQRIKAKAIHEEDGLEAYFEFSARSGKNNLKQDTGYTWNTLHPERTTGDRLQDAAWAADPEGYMSWLLAEKPRPGAVQAFDDGVVEAELPPKPEPRKGLTFTPYEWIDPDKIEPRAWIYGDLLIRGFITMTVAPGGAGKSSLIVAEALAQVTGRNLLGAKISSGLRVALWNLEDPHIETKRKIQAASIRYKVTKADIDGRLFVDSGRDQRFVIAEMHQGKPTIMRPVVEAAIEQIKLHKIDVLVVDPFVSCHELPENDNMAQDRIVKEWGRVAELGNCAVHLIDHTRKAPVGTEIWTESSRGAKSKTDAARVVRVINRMSDTEGASYGVSNPRQYFYTLLDKANMTAPPPKDYRDWFCLENVNLGNGGIQAGVGAGIATGDNIGVAVQWDPPSPADFATGDAYKALVAAMEGKQWRKDLQTGKKWIGYAVAQALNLDPDAPKDRTTIKKVVEQWLNASWLKEVEQLDERRKPKIFIEIAKEF